MNARLFQRLLSTDAPAATLLVRILVGAVFLLEGVLKFLDPVALGAGRFAKIGIPFPGVMGPFVGAVEIAAGSFLLSGLFTRFSAAILWIDISVAILTTKVPIFLGRAFWIFSLPRMQQYGFWSMAHEMRTDFCMWLGCIFLLIVGAGPLSLDRRLDMRFRNSKRRSRG